MKKILLVVLLAAPLTACDLFSSDDDKSSPTEPVICTSPAPAALSATVSPGACDSSRCQASYSLQAQGASRVSWSFPGGNPGESSNFTGTVTFVAPNNFPAGFDWSATACACPPAADAFGASCRSTNGRVVFSSAQPSTFIP